MLENKLYEIINLDYDKNNPEKILATIKLDKSHNIFKGHFPDNPVLPGVCFIQIVIEILSNSLGEKLILSSAGNIKYLEVINPEVNNILKIEIDLKNFNDRIDAMFIINSLIMCEEKTCFKMTAEMKIV